MDHQTLETLSRPTHRIRQLVLKASFSAVRSRLGQNILSLYALQFANYVLPLITIPYLVRVLGPEKFGAVAFGQSLVMYLVLLVEYGFNWSATRTVAVQQGNLSRVGRTASAVLSAKLLLCGLSLLLLTGLILCVPRLREMSVLLYILFGVVLGHALFPQWLFQGLERMVEISAINMGMRVLATVGVFAAIHTPEDYLIYAGLLGFQWIGAGVFGLAWANRRLSVPLNLPSREEVIRAFQDGWTIFLSTAAISLYTTGNSFILGVLTNNISVGYYAAAEKIAKAALGLVSPISQGFYPRVANKASLSKTEGLRWARMALFSMGGLGLAISVGLFVGAPWIVDLLLGTQYEPSVIPLRILSFLPFLIAISNVLGVQTMLPFHLDKPFTTILIVAGIINFSLALLLAPIWQASGMAVAVAFTELYVTATMWFYLMVKGLLPFSEEVRKWQDL